MTNIIVFNFFRDCKTDLKADQNNAKKPADTTKNTKEMDAKNKEIEDLKQRFAEEMEQIKKDLVAVSFFMLHHNVFI